MGLTDNRTTAKNFAVRLKKLKKNLLCNNLQWTHLVMRNLVHLDLLFLFLVI